MGTAGWIWLVLYAMASALVMGSPWLMVRWHERKARLAKAKVAPLPRYSVAVVCADEAENGVGGMVVDIASRHYLVTAPTQEMAVAEVVAMALSKGQTIQIVSAQPIPERA